MCAELLFAEKDEFMLAYEWSTEATGFDEPW